MKAMRKFVVLAALVVLLAGLPLSGISDSKISVADTGVPDDEVTNTVNQTDSPISANATITITMRTPPLPDG